jgi:ubiquinone/menaquinone biosynthesis C-methylase UbiE
MSFTYLSNYDSPALRGNDASQRPWDLVNEIISEGGKEKKLLDIGCGTAFKLIPLSQHFGAITGIDISEDMIHAAHNSIIKHAANNIQLLHCDSNNLPFKDKTYDVVTCMLSRWDLREIARILKPNGHVIVEHLGCEDKKEFKILFGKDDSGWRGQFINYKRDKYLNYFHEMFSDFFEFVSIKNGFWNTFYTELGILELLKFTPTIRNFNQISDNKILKLSFDIFKKPGGIALTQNRILIHAKNPRNF